MEDADPAVHYVLGDTVDLSGGLESAHIKHLDDGDDLNKASEQLSEWRAVTRRLRELHEASSDSDRILPANCLQRLGTALIEEHT